MLPRANLSEALREVKQRGESNGRFVAATRSSVEMSRLYRPRSWKTTPRYLATLLPTHRTHRKRRDVCATGPHIDALPGSLQTWRALADINLSPHCVATSLPILSAVRVYTEVFPASWAGSTFLLQGRTHPSA